MTLYYMYKSVEENGDYGGRPGVTTISLPRLRRIVSVIILNARKL